MLGIGWLEGLQRARGPQGAPRPPQPPARNRPIVTPHGPFVDRVLDDLDDDPLQRTMDTGGVKFRRPPFGLDAAGWVNPLVPQAGLRINPDILGSDDELAGTIAHEAQHLSQTLGRSPLANLTQMLRDKATPYNQRPDEVAAFDTEQAFREKRAMRARRSPVDADGQPARAPRRPRPERASR